MEGFTDMLSLREPILEAGDLLSSLLRVAGFVSLPDGTLPFSLLFSALDRAILLQRDQMRFVSLDSGVGVGSS